MKPHIRGVNTHRGQRSTVWRSRCIVGLPLTQRVGELLGVLVQVLMQVIQLSDIPAGHRFKQPIDVKRLAVSLAAVLRLPSNPSVSKNISQTTVRKDSRGSKGRAASYSTLPLWGLIKHSTRGVMSIKKKGESHYL